GEERVLQSRILVKHDSRGEATELVGFTLDITTHRQQTRELEMRNARLMEIAWVQSHEVRAPLARLMGLVHLLIHNAEDARTLRETLPHILSSATDRSEEHTSELQSRENLVCRLLLEKK